MALIKAVVFNIVCCHAAANPTIKSAWSATFYGKGTIGNVELDVSFNLPSNFRMDQTITMPTTPYPYTWYTSYGDDPSGWTTNITMNGTHCFPDRVPWSQVVHDFGFGWLSEAIQNGSKTVAGSSCRVWTHSEEKRYDWAACIDDQNMPREFSVRAHPEEVGSSMVTYLSFSVTMKEQTLRMPKVVVTKACADWPPPLCPDQGIKTMIAYRDTSFVTPAPDNQNGGDARGQGITAFLYKSSYVTAYEVTHNTSYSQYAMCNYVSNGGVGNKCVGGGRTIGRAPLFRMCNGKPQCGQCTPNEDLGNWLSFPREGECQGGKNVGTDGCTWKSTLKKVVDYDCVMTNQTKALCGRAYVTHDDECMNAFKSQIANCPAVTPPVEDELAPTTLLVV